MTTPDASAVSVEERLEATWEQLLAHRFAGRAVPQDHPEAVLIVGQPCSGKSVLAEAVRRDFDARGKAVSIDLTDLQLLHPAAGVSKERRSRDIDECIVSSTGNAAARMLIAATDRRQHIVAACRVEFESNVAALVEDLHRQGYPVTVLVPVVGRDVSWQRAVECAKSSAGACMPDLARRQHDLLCGVLVDALERVEQQALADSMCWLDSTGRVLGLMERGAGWTIGTARRILAEHAPAIDDDVHNPPVLYPPRNEERDPGSANRAHPLEPTAPHASSAKRNWTKFESSQDRQLERRHEFLRVLELRAENEAKGRG